MPDLGWWLTLKARLVELTSLERDAWHIYLGVTIQLVTAVVLRWRLSQWRTLLPLLLLELLNETVDLTYEVWPNQRLMQWTAAAHDVANTAVMPIVILLIARAIERRAGGDRL